MTPAIRHIFTKEMTIELRQRFAAAGIILFTATLVFLVYKIFNEVNTREWIVLLWIIMLFAAINAIVKSFMQERRETYLYYYTLFHPVDLIIAKILYNFLFLILLLACVMGFFGVFTGIPVRDYVLFSAGSLAGLAGISITFTFVSLLSASENGNATLMSILSLPLVLPVVLLLLKITAVSTRLLSDSAIWEDLMLLISIDAILLGAVLLLFPVMWKS